MRLQMKLAGETIAAMDMASFYTLGKDWDVSRGDLIKYAVDQYADTYRDIDWLNVGTPPGLPEAQSIQTAFELSEKTVGQLCEMQQYFSKVFSAKRIVYKPFVIKMLFYKLLQDHADSEAAVAIDHNVLGLMTLNFGDETFKGDEEDKKTRLNAYYQKMTGECIIGLQEYNVGEGKWLGWWKEKGYVVLAPENIEKHPEIHFASVTLVKKEAFQGFEPLRLKTGLFYNRYVYGILTVAPNRRLRYLNIHIPQSIQYQNETETQYEKRLSNIEELWKAVIGEVKKNMDREEEWVLTGDLNAYEASRFKKYLMELKTLLVDINVDAQGHYIAETWRDKKLDYILLDRRTALKGRCEASVENNGIDFTDHGILTARAAETSHF